MVSLVRAIDLLIYLSVALGVVLLPQLYGIVPPWLFYSVLGGWLAYVFVAILTATRHRIAYVFALALSILTLLVSAPQPEHQSFVMAGLSLASMTFLLGSTLQLALLILIPIQFIRMRRKRA
jgi:hypothetical protein